MTPTTTFLRIVIAIAMQNKHNETNSRSNNNKINKHIEISIKTNNNTHNSRN